jgi:hypothetical protein
MRFCLVADIGKELLHTSTPQFAGLSGRHECNRPDERKTSHPFLFHPDRISRTISLMRVFSIFQTALEHFWTEQMELLHVCSFVQPIVSPLRKSVRLGVRMKSPALHFHSRICFFERPIYRIFHCSSKFHWHFHLKRKDIEVESCQGVYTSPERFEYTSHLFSEVSRGTENWG